MSDGTLTERLDAQAARFDEAFDPVKAKLLLDAAARIRWLEEELRNAEDDTEFLRAEVQFGYERSDY